MDKEVAQDALQIAGSSGVTALPSDTSGALVY